MIERIRVRAATIDDYELYARLFGELGVDDPIPPRERFATEIAAGCTIAELDGAPAAYCLVQSLPRTAYVRNLAVAPRARRRGLARALLEAVARAARERGADAWCLNVKPDNEPAIRLYEAMGMRLAFRSTALRMDWTITSALPPGGGDITAGPANADSDADAEARFDLPGGLLAAARRRAGSMLVELREAGARAPAGIAVFAPSFPGAFPFRVARPALAGPLLRALRPYADDRPFVMLAIEDDARLSELLIAAGAERTLESVHFRGAL
jgi:GNAT superfamily N-acetyltransferase